MFECKLSGICFCTLKHTAGAASGIRKVKEGLPGPWYKRVELKYQMRKVSKR
jgi:hypothetical protein